MGAGVVLGVRVEIPKCLYILETRYEICVMCYVFWQLWVPVVIRSSCAFKTRLVLWQPREMLPSQLDSHPERWVRAAAATV